MATKRMLGKDESSEIQALKMRRLLGFQMRVARDWELNTNWLCLEKHIEGFIRQPVQDGVMEAFKNHFPLASGPPSDLIEVDVASPYELHFGFRLAHTLFTDRNIEAENGKGEIVIRDAKSKQIITTGHLASIKVEIVVLDNEFGNNEQERWTKEEFDTSVVRPRKDKRPLLKGQLEIKMRDGVGYLDNISFTDNSSWNRNKKFRLGARVKESSGCGQRIKEAKSEAFTVRDQRGEQNRKDRQPSSNDEVCRLKHISRDGAYYKRLTNMGITTVQQFLNFWFRNPERLLHILGARMTEKKLKEIVQHATTGSDYPCDDPDSGTPTPGSSLDFANAPKKQACKNQDRIVKWDGEEAYNNPLMPRPRLQAASSTGPSLAQQNPNLLLVQGFQLGNYNDLPECSSQRNGDVASEEVPMTPLLSQTQGSIFDRNVRMECPVEVNDSAEHLPHPDMIKRNIFSEWECFHGPHVEYGDECGLMVPSVPIDHLVSGEAVETLVKETHSTSDISLYSADDVSIYFTRSP